MYAVYAQCASVRPIQPFYLTKREAPYKGYSPSAAWGVILDVGLQFGSDSSFKLCSALPAC
jgi:hypothetical protein